MITLVLGARSDEQKKKKKKKKAKDDDTQEQNEKILNPDQALVNQLPVDPAFSSFFLRCQPWFLNRRYSRAHCSSFLSQNRQS